MVGVYSWNNIDALFTFNFELFPMSQDLFNIIPLAATTSFSA